ncbi:MAG: hypothetical protein HQL87_02260 [Magnetococcales bacterium]|nr:hypothetical protein [Magnetococcales bacterium]
MNIMTTRGRDERAGQTMRLGARVKPAGVWVVVLGLLAVLLPRGGVASEAMHLPKQNWPFVGVFGQFDNAALKRGVQVTVQVCMACHSLKYIKFDRLRQFGFTEQEVKAFAESQGRTKKDAMLSGMDPVLAKDSFGVVPPDLSLITKARKGYEDYVFGILTGYASESDVALARQVMADGHAADGEVREVAATLHLDPNHPEKIAETLKRIADGGNFNKYFPGHFLAMPQPLMDGAVVYADGTENSKVQMARDVVTFLAWAAEPTQTERKALGFNVLLYLVVFTLMLYALKRRIWARVH